MAVITNLKYSTSSVMSDEPVDREPLVPIATGLRRRGADGRLTARLVTVEVDQLCGRSSLLVGRLPGPLRRVNIEEYRVYGDKLILKLEGVDSASAAQAFAGQDILMPRNGLVDLPEGAYYIFELVGLTVETRAGRQLGTVRHIVETGGTPLLAIVPPGGADGRVAREEILLPAARSICAIIDMAARRITVDLPEGLLDLYGI